MTTTQPSGLSRFAPLAVRLAAAWLFAGAVAKLFFGTPKLLPPLVRDHSPFALDLTFHVAIAIELSIVAVAMLKPRIGWLPLVALFVFFEAVLVHQASLGAESCGCFGSSVKIPPALMMCVDGALLAFIFLTRPWRAFGVESAGRAVPIALAIALATSWAAPWIVIGISNRPSTPVGPVGSPTASVETPRYIDMDPPGWLHKPIHEVAELTRWVPPEKIPTDGKIVMWRQGCEHCAKHLRELSTHDDGTQAILLVQARDDLKNSREVDAMPQGSHVASVELPENVDCGFITPVEIRVAGGVVDAVLYEKDFEAQASAPDEQSK